MNEMLKLKEMLENVGAEFTFKNLFDGYQIQLFYKNEKIDDVIWHRYSHGYKKGLLETYFLNGCNGYETATEVFDGWEKMLLEIQEKASK